MRDKILMLRINLACCTLRSVREFIRSTSGPAKSVRLKHCVVIANTSSSPDNKRRRKVLQTIFVFSYQHQRKFVGLKYESCPIKQHPSRTVRWCFEQARIKTRMWCQHATRLNAHHHKTRHISPHFASDILKKKLAKIITDRGWSL